MENIADFVGISTNTMAGIDIWEAVELTRKYELSCFEIHLGDFEAAVGDPWMIPHAGVWPRTFDKEQRKRLRKEMAHIKNLVIHGTPIDLNIAALNPGIREESKKQYIEGIDLAVDLGAKWVTYHPGRPTNSVVPPQYAEDRNVEFIMEVIERSKSEGIKLAYENFNANLLTRIPDKNFGLLLDIGHSVMMPNKFAPSGRGDTQTVLDWIDLLGDRLIEMHLHNVINWSENAALGTAHRSFEYGLCINLEKVIKKLKASELIVPMISEIYEPTPEKAIQTLAKTKDDIIKYWSL